MLSNQACEGILEQMSEDPWFGSLDLSLRQAMLLRCQRSSLRAGQFAFRQGDDRPVGFADQLVVCNRLAAEMIDIPGLQGQGVLPALLVDQMNAFSVL